MPPDRNLRVGLRWQFQPLDGPHGSILWKWSAFDYAGHPVLAAETTFETFSECIEDAKVHGYVEPDLR